MNITGTLSAVRVGYGDSHVTIETDAGPAEIQCWRAQAHAAEPLQGQLVRVEVEWLVGGFFGLAELRGRCSCCEAPTGPDCEDCGARQVRGAN